MKMPGRDDQGFVDISATALNAAISGSILADPDACLVTRIALPLGSTRALATAHDIRLRPPCRSDPSASFRSAVSTAPVSSHPWEMPMIRSFPLMPTSSRASTMAPVRRQNL